MSEQSPAASADAAHAKSYDKGPVSIEWATKQGDPTSVHVEVSLSGQRVASNSLSPGDTNWNTGRHEGSDGYVEAEFDFQVPTRGQEGQLELVRLVWNQGESGDENITTNQLLDSWEYGAGDSTAS
jgi:hypothetical protein